MPAATRRRANLNTYNARYYEARYLAGWLAGKTSKSGIAGYVAGFPVPEVVQGINAFALGMRAANPKAQVRVLWLNTWFDPAREREAAQTLINQGADVLTNHSGSPAVPQAAQAAFKDKGVRVIAYQSDMSAFAPDAQLAAVTHHWGGYYTRVRAAVIDGTLEAAAGVGRHEGRPGAAQRRRRPRCRRSCAASSRPGARPWLPARLKPFAGRIVDNTGPVRLARGTLDDGADRDDELACCWRGRQLAGTMSSTNPRGRTMLRRILGGGLLIAALCAGADARTLRIASANDPQSMDPHALSLQYQSRVVTQIYEGLVNRGRDFKLEPSLAESWERTAPLVWRFKLRPGVKFHDGTPFAADDAVFSIERAMMRTSQRANQLRGIAGVSKLDARTIEIRTAETDAVLPEKLWLVAMMSKAWSEKNKVTQPQDYNARQETFSVRNANGTGPFMLDRYEADARTVLKANPRWWGTRHALRRRQPRRGRCSSSSSPTPRGWPRWPRSRSTSCWTRRCRTCRA